MRRACGRGACDRWRSNSLFSQRARRRYRVGGLEHGRAAVEIERLSWLRPRYALRDDRGRGGLWVRRRFTETLSGEIAGQTYEFERDGRRRFTLVQSVRVLMTADAAGRGRWSIAADNSSYELRRKSPWRSEMELRSGDATIGSIRKGKPPRGKVVCELPPSPRRQRRRLSDSWCAHSETAPLPARERPRSQWPVTDDAASRRRRVFARSRARVDRLHVAIRVDA